MPDLTKVKFKENGDFNAFAGNTVVANLYDNQRLMAVVNKIQDEYRKLPFIDKFTLTPNQSIHMTVIELLCDKNRLPEYWSKDLPLDMPIEEIHDYFGEKLSDFPLTNENILMKVNGMGRQNLLLEPADEASRQRLEEIRAYVSERAGVAFPNHDSYQYHVSIGYCRIPFTEEEEALFQDHRERMTELLKEALPLIPIRRIDYTTFEDMTQFTPYVKK